MRLQCYGDSPAQTTRLGPPLKQDRVRPCTVERLLEALTCLLGAAGVSRTEGWRVWLACRDAHYEVRVTAEPRVNEIEKAIDDIACSPSGEVARPFVPRAPTELTGLARPFLLVDGARVVWSLNGAILCRGLGHRCLENGFDAVLTVLRKHDDAGVVLSREGELASAVESLFVPFPIECPSRFVHAPLTLGGSPNGATAAAAQQASAA